MTDPLPLPKGASSSKSAERFAALMGLIVLAIFITFAVSNARCTTQQRLELAQAGHVFANAACSIEPYLDSATSSTGYHLVVHIQPGAFAVTSTAARQSVTIVDVHTTKDAGVKL